MIEKLKATFNFDRDPESEITILGMGPLESVLAAVLVVFIVDVVFNNGALLSAVLGVF